MLLLLVSALLASVHICEAASCWRTTTCDGQASAAFPGIWDDYIYAPKTRDVEPVYVLLADASSGTSYNGTIILDDNDAEAVLDFGIEVGGIISLNYTIDGPGVLGLAFTESKDFIGKVSDDSNGGFTPDGYLAVNITEPGPGSYEVPLEKLRGGFRYLTLFLIADGNTSIKVTDISLEIGFQPTWPNLRAYHGYFYSSDDTLNKIWYSGAYTLQTNTVPVSTGRHIPAVKDTWLNDGILGNGSSIIVDGAKRDRAVWPGDMGIAVPSTFYSIGELGSVKNALQAMYDHQNTDGSFPEAGPPLLQQGSDTYHMWTMIGTWNYVHYSNDTSFLSENWEAYQAAMEYIYAKVISPGLLNVTGIRDWARWQQGFNNSEANMILYRTLITGSDLAIWAGDTTNLSASYQDRAAKLQAAINVHLWDSSVGAFRDNATATTLYPQDANSMAAMFNLTTKEQDQSISERLTKNWNAIGAVSPELPGEISPFISSFEIQAHFAAGQTSRALDLIRRSWGWYLNNTAGTQSTVVEGYLEDGSFGYRHDRGYDNDTSYVSHSHGWSSGPTSALTNYVLGLTVTGLAGAQWTLVPQFGDLTSAEGGFMTILGQFKAAWEVLDDGGSYNVTVSTPSGTKGTVLLPLINNVVSAEVSLDNGDASVWKAGELGKLKGFLKHVDGGNHTFTVHELKGR